LKPNGIIRIVVPDLQDIVARYTAGELRSDDFIERLGVLFWPHPNPVKNKLAPYVQSPHKCMYDSETLVRILTELGFSVRNRRLFESDIEDIKAVEIERKINKQVIVEGRKQ
jgi:predicted SAM-dependent methyltransferase